MASRSFHVKFLAWLTMLCVPPASALIIRAFGFTESSSDASPIVSSDIFHGLLWLTLVSMSVFGASLGLWVSYFMRNQNVSHFIRARVERSMFSVFAIISIIMGVVTISIFLGGFISGSIFPHLDVADYNFGHDFRAAEIGKILVWGFASGFSERLIPDFMDRLTDQFSRSGNNAGDSISES